MAGWLEGIVISKSIQHNLDSVAVLRFHTDYVNSLNSHIYYALLQSLNLRGLAGSDQVICFP